MSAIHDPETPKQAVEQLLTKARGQLDTLMAAYSTEELSGGQAAAIAERTDLLLMEAYLIVRRNLRTK